MKLDKIFVILIASSIITSCAFAPVDRPDENKYYGNFLRSKTYDISLENAVNSTEETLKAMGFEIQATNMNLGLVRTKTMRLKVPQNCDCGTWNGSEINGAADFNVVVTFDSKTDLQTSINLETKCSTIFSGQNLYGATTRRETYDCASRGVVENDFWVTIERILDSKNKKR